MKRTTNSQTDPASRIGVRPRVSAAASLKIAPGTSSRQPTSQSAILQRSSSTYPTRPLQAPVDDLLLSIIAQLPVAAMLIDKNGEIAFANEQAELVFQYRREELTGKSFSAVVPEFMPVDQLMRAIADARTHRVRDFEKQILRRDGTWLRISVSVSALKSHNETFLIASFRTPMGEEAELPESSAELRLLLDSTREGIYELDVDGNCTFCNSAAARTLGYQPEHLLGKNMHQLIHHTRHDGTPFPESECPILDAGRSGKHIKLKDELLWRADNTSFPAAYSASPRYRSGKLVGSVVVFRDITEEAANQKALKESEERFAKAFRESPMALSFTRLSDNVLLDVNEQFERLTGYTRSELIGQTPIKLGLWADTAQRVFFISKVLQDGHIYNQEIAFRRKDGTTGTSLASMEVIELGGEPVGLTVISDITAIKEAQQATREAEARFRVVANTAPVFIWMSGPDKLCTWFNQGWLEFTGRSMDEEVGNGWADGVHPDDLAGCFQIYSESFDQRKPFIMKYRLRRHDGQYRWITDHGVPRFESDGTFMGYIGSAVDITEEWEAREAARDFSRKLIEAQEEERRRIARELHDDVNQRLAVLAVNLDRLRKTRGTHSMSLSHIRQKISELLKAATSISSEVQSLSHELHASSLQYLGIIPALRRYCSDLGRHHQQNINFVAGRISPRVPYEVSLALYRIVQESLQNALKHGKATKLAVKISSTTDEIRLTVRDNGVGFVPEKVKSEGLGLISMRERATLLGGSFDIQSQPKQGTEITVSVPVHVRQPASLEPVLTN